MHLVLSGSSRAGRDEKSFVAFWLAREKYPKKEIKASPDLLHEIPILHCTVECSRVE